MDNIRRLNQALHQLQPETTQYRSKLNYGEYPSMPLGEPQRYLFWGEFMTIYLFFPMITFYIRSSHQDKCEKVSTNVKVRAQDILLNKL